MSDSPLIQIGSPIRQTDEWQVVLRMDDNQDVATLLAVLNRVSLEVVPLFAGLVRAVNTDPGIAVAALQQAGMNPQVIPQPPQQDYNQGQPPQWAAPQEQQQLTQGQYHAGSPQPQVQQYQPQQAFHQPAQQQAPQPMQGQGWTLLETGPCWVGTATGGTRNHERACKDCGAPTLHTIITIGGGKKVNGHECSSGQRHKATWCDSPIWNSKRTKAEGMGIPVNPNLLFD